MLNNLKYSIKKTITLSALVIGSSMFAQNTLTITDNPVAAMLDSLANQKILEKALAKPVYPKTNKYKYTEDSIPRFEDFVYESRLAKLDANSPFDLVYNPSKTKFLNKGKEKGCTIKNGYDMLIIQAEENWKIWNL
mgnify:CR=1 FL=1